VREFATTLLDAAGLVLVAAGVIGGAWEFVGWWALSIGGAVVLAGSALAARNLGRGES
jgi:hypothetical protein